MKRWRFQWITGVGSASALLVLVGIVTWLMIKPPTHDCMNEETTTPQRFSAAKVVVKPWMGRHEVFGIFMVPLRYRSSKTYSGTISVNGYTDEFHPDWDLVQHVEGIKVRPGYYLVKVYLPTRVALLFLFSGRFGDLRAPCNWTVGFVKRGL
jgi:hypothetical protein